MANGKTNGEAPKTADKKVGCCGCNCWGYDFGKKIMITLLGVLLVYAIFVLGTIIRNNIKKFDYIGRADSMEHTIAVSGYGKVTGNNDIAVTTLGYSNVDMNVAKAQADNKKVMDGVMGDLKAMGIADKDLQSDYSVYPEYNYTQDKGQELKGYRVTSNVTVKIRDLKNIDKVLSLAGKYKANQVSGLSFTIDDPQNLKSQARDKALLDAENKAVHLAKVLGVKLVAVTSYNEYEGGMQEYYPTMKAYGLGGGAMDAASSVAPVSAGSKDVVMNVNVVYQISP